MTIESNAARALLLELVRALRVFRAAGQSRARRTFWGTEVSALQSLVERDTRLSDLAHRLTVSASVTSRAVDALEQDGLVDRHPDPADARAAIISITEAGRKLLLQRQQFVAEKFAEVLDDWTDDEAQQALQVLQRLNIGLEHLTDIIKTDQEGPATA